MVGSMLESMICWYGKAPALFTFSICAGMPITVRERSYAPYGLPSLSILLLRLCILDLHLRSMAFEVRVFKMKMLTIDMSFVLSPLKTDCSQTSNQDPSLSLI
jgi:hypothetical protein